MAFPVILVNNTQGTDGVCSGAGPATALGGVNNASTDGAGTTVTVQAGVDWTGVATDGSHVLYFADSTAGNRRYTTITGTAGSGGATPTLTVSPALGLTVTNKTWAVGGKLATIGSASSKVLFDNNAAAGDAMPGWIIELAEGHVETIAATFDCRRAGDTTSGPIILRGDHSAATRPVLTFSNNGNGFVSRADFQWFRDFEIRNSNATKTASVAFVNSAATRLVIINVKIAHATDKFWKAITEGGSGVILVKDCEIGYTANIGVDVTGAGRFRYFNNYIHDCGATAGFNVAVSGATVWFRGNIVANCTGDGFRQNIESTSAQSFLDGNTFYNNTSDGFESTATTNPIGPYFINNIFANNGGYGVNFSGASITAVSILDNILMLNNNFFTNSSGKYFPTTITASENETTADPQFTSTAGADFSIGTNLKKTGYPLGGTLKVGTGSGTYSYPDPGAAQRNEDAIFGYLPVAP